MPSFINACQRIPEVVQQTQGGRCWKSEDENDGSDVVEGLDLAMPEARKLGSCANKFPFLIMPFYTVCQLQLRVLFNFPLCIKPYPKFYGEYKGKSHTDLSFRESTEGINKYAND